MHVKLSHKANSIVCQKSSRILCTLSLSIYEGCSWTLFLTYKYLDPLNLLSHSRVSYFFFSLSCLSFSTATWKQIQKWKLFSKEYPLQLLSYAWSFLLQELQEKRKMSLDEYFHWNLPSRELVHLVYS